MSKRTVIEIIGGILLIGIGASAAGGSTARAVPQPTPQVIVTQVPGPERTVEVTASPQIVEVTASPQVVEVTAEPIVQEVTPQACLDALDDADQGFALAGRGFTTAGDIVDALISGDINEAEKQVNNLRDVSDQMNSLAPVYNEHKAACRSQ